MQSTTDTTPRTSPWWLFARLALGVGAAAALVYGALLLAFFGLIFFTGCFWACNQADPQPLAGLLLFVGATAAAGGAVTALVPGFVGKRLWLKRVFFWSAAMVGVLLVAISANA